MYKNIIDIRREVSQEDLQVLMSMADKAFDNRAGKVENSSTSPYRLVYQGGEGEYGCLNLGMLSLCGSKGFISRVLNWNWIDEDEPDESCDVMKEMMAKNPSASDPFYSEQNHAQLRRAMEQLEEGRVVTKTIEELEALAES